MILKIIHIISVKKNIIHFFFLIIFFFSPLRAIQENQGLFPSRHEKQLFEIGEIRFVGNYSYPGSELMGILASQATEYTPLYQIFRTLSDNVNRLRHVPVLLKKALNESVKSRISGIRFFNELNIEQDSVSIINFYNQNGFHEACVKYSFLPDSANSVNVLTFYIEEGRQYSIGTINYLGLDSIAPDVYPKILENQRLTKGDPFNEEKIQTDINSIYRVLKDNGYFYSYYERPPEVYRDASAYIDSVIVRFFPGRRMRIGRIDFIDSLKGQQIISYHTKQQMLDIRSGEWYSYSKIRNSENNFLYLGLFDITKIDTSSKFALSMGDTLNLTVYNQYKKQSEWNFGLFMNRTPIENTLNIGVEGEYINKNAFGKAQVFNPFARYVLQDISWVFENFARTRSEFQIGLQFGQPLVWELDNSEVGIYSNPNWSYRFVNTIIKLSTISLPFKFPVKLPGWTYFNNLIIDLTFERQWPISYDEAINSALDSARKIIDTVKQNDLIRKILESQRLYSNLDAFVKSPENPWLTGNIIGLTIMGDHRDNRMAPSSGDFAQISLDGWNIFLSHPKISGIAKFIRFQFAYYDYEKLSRKSILALKGRFGIIKLFDEQNSYVPADRQFFAGGANSVRGWSSRSLRYTKLKPQDFSDQTVYNFISDFIGSSSIFEATAEMRYKIGKTGFAGSAIDDQLANISLAAFVDIGNTYGWLVGDNLNLDWYEYISNLAVAGGFGIRYETPIGPIRLDIAWPVYDPMNENEKLIFNRQNAFINEMKIHLALGYPF
ncbi:MAG: hypothetical protein QG635_1966 [Bacteroidota bacterium]|nr:hypothetical protein [Bacteroidota bacterium]